MLSTILAMALWTSGASQPPPSAVVADIRVHGNLATPDAEILTLADVRVGMPLETTTADRIAARLRATGRFRRVEVLKRFASIADPTQIVLVIVVDEGPVTIELTGDPSRPTRVVRKHGLNLLVSPILNAEDGYGVIYGAQFAWPDPIGKGSRLSFPLTWGGEKRAALELERRFDAGPFTRLTGGASISRRENPFFKQDDDRRRVWMRGERQMGRFVRVAAFGGWQQVSFGGREDRFGHAGGEAIVDTRVDPFLARNAVYARASAERFGLPGGAATRMQLDGRGYVGLIGQSVLVVRALREESDRPLPDYLKPLLGGISNLRGFRAGSAAGDTLTGGSIELRVPLTSPLSVGKIGVSLFADTATVYDKRQRLQVRPFDRGYGAGLWFTAAFVRFGVDVAHGVGGTTRAHFGGGVSF